MPFKARWTRNMGIPRKTRNKKLTELLRNHRSYFSCFNFLWFSLSFSVSYILAIILDILYPSLYSFIVFFGSIHVCHPSSSSMNVIHGWHRKMTLSTMDKIWSSFYDTSPSMDEIWHPQITLLYGSNFRL